MTDTIVTSNPKTYSSLNFHKAAEAGDLQAIKMWAAQGENIRVELRKALDLAAQSGQLEVVKYLSEHGAHPYVEEAGAMLSAAAQGHLEVVKYLVERGASVNSKNGGEALMWAIYSGYLEIVKYLVDQGFDLPTRSESALSMAISMGHLEIVKYLLDQGTNPNGNEGEHVKEAATYGRLEILKCLVAHGADLDAWGREAIIAATKFPTFNQEVIGYLLGQEITKKEKKVFVVMDTDSTFIGVYSCRKNAHEVIKRMGGKFLDDKDLIIAEERLDDFSMFDPIMSDEQLRESILKRIKVTLYAGGGDIREYDRWEDAEKALFTCKKENNRSNAYIHGWHPSERDLCMMSAKDLRIVSSKNLG